jgi:hypothetical protein
MKHRGLFDEEELLKRLSELGDSLEKLELFGNLSFRTTSDKNQQNAVHFA